MTASASTSKPTTSDPVFVEWLGALSLATDLANGAADGTALRGAVLAGVVSDLLGLDADLAAAAVYTTLFRYLGCTSYAHEEAAFFGDEADAIANFAPVDKTERLAILRGVVQVTREEKLPARVMRFARMVVGGSDFQKGFETTHCEAALQLTARLDVLPGVRDGLSALYERWDGGGPTGRFGTQIPLVARIVHVAREALVQFLCRGGEPAVRRCLAKRSGGQLDPQIVKATLGSKIFFEALHAEPLWETATALLLRHLPRAFATLPDLDAVASIFGDMADLKYPVFVGHSRRVADLTRRTAEVLGLAEPTITLLGRAAALHDIGTVTVPNRIWSKTGPLDPIEWERVRLHGYHGERICQRLADKKLAQLVGNHHERSDGSGYARGAVPDLLSGILAAADVCAALGENRAHRPPLDEERIARTLELEAREGRLRTDVIPSLLTAIGRPSRRGGANRETLTERERDVLRLVARGMSNKEVASRLNISPRTVQVHTIHAYDKLGVRSRAGAALRATELGLL